MTNITIRIENLPITCEYERKIMGKIFQSDDKKTFFRYFNSNNKFDYLTIPMEAINRVSSF